VCRIAVLRIDECRLTIRDRDIDNRRSAIAIDDWQSAIVTGIISAQSSVLRSAM